ncbi:MAG TPA: hypothetical protein VIJ92_06560, partial [Ginsengibacter sp.]
FGAMNMDASGGWGNGHASSFDQALSQYNGGNITADMAREYLSITEGMQVGDLSATSVDGGFNISYTASKTGNSYSDVFTSTQIIKSGLDFLSTQDGNNQGSNDLGEDNSFEGNIFKGSQMVGEAWDLAQAPGFISKSYQSAAMGAAKTGAMEILGKATGLISVYQDGVGIKEAYDKGDVGGVIWNGVKGVGTLGVMIFGGEELELGWNLGTMAVDGLADLFSDNY